MKYYEGRRTIDGISVTVDGMPLDPRYDLERFTELGFEWSYKGDSPQQLALALIADCIGPDQARRWSEPVMVKVIAELDNDWQLTEDDVRSAVQLISP
ncbi:MAG TPA: hypothetical protein EYP93_11320 [Gammaproteobacteria bacterium]|nr:hypothetical protein [Gammaproteobacteria bacterium]